MHLAIWVMACLLYAAQFPMTVEASVQVHRAGFSDLQGWTTADHAKAFKSLALSCQQILKSQKGFSTSAVFAGERSDWIPVCQQAEAEPDISARRARAFFETHFLPVRAGTSSGPGGLFTGYYEPQVAGSRRPSADFPVPVYAKPKDLITFNKEQAKATGLKYGRIINGKPAPYVTRRQIEQGAIAGRGLELVWLKSWADAFFMQVQGSGRVGFEDGTTMKLGYAAKSGLPYTAIGAVLIRNGEVAREDMSMQAIRSWMDANPDKSRQLMWQNESFLFFRPIELADQSLGPIGAHQVQLQAGHSLAVDRTYWAYGTPMWLETTLPGIDGRPAGKFHQLLIAQDTGTAIKGLVRGDIFFGAGEAAAQLAGKMQAGGRLYALLPRETVHRLGLKD